MEPSKKNKPGPLVVTVIVLIVVMIVLYFALSMYFPDLFQNMSTGETQTVSP